MASVTSTIHGSTCILTPATTTIRPGTKLIGCRSHWDLIDTTSWFTRFRMLFYILRPVDGEVVCMVAELSAVFDFGTPTMTRYNRIQFNACCVTWDINLNRFIPTVVFFIETTTIKEWYCLLSISFFTLIREVKVQRVSIAIAALESNGLVPPSFIILSNGLESISQCPPLA